MYVNRIDAKRNAREKIKGNWQYLFFTMFLMGLAVFLITGILVTIRGEIGYGIVGAIYGIIETAISLIVFLGMVPLYMAFSKKVLTVSRGGKPSDVNLFCYFKDRDYWEKVKATLFIALYVAVGCVLFIVPGIIIALRYSVIGFVFADNPKIGYRDALEKCKEITYGHKWEIFVFDLSFILWHLLAVLTLGILEIWIIPYQNVAFASLYDIINPREESPIGEENVFEDYDFDSSKG